MVMAASAGGKPEDMSMNSTERRSALCMPKAIMSEIPSRSGPKRSSRFCDVQGSDGPQICGCRKQPIQVVIHTGARFRILLDRLAPPDLLNPPMSRSAHKSCVVCLLESVPLRRREENKILCLPF